MCLIYDLQNVQSDKKSGRRKTVLSARICYSQMHGFSVASLLKEGYKAFAW